MDTPFYKTWWFRLVVIGVLAVATYYASYLPSYLRWREAMKPYDEQNQKLAEYYEYKETEKKSREALYRADTYGGDTPEETLELFIQALEAENYELASKYFVPEAWSKELEDFKEAKGIDMYLEILKTYERDGGMFTSGDKYQIDFMSGGEQWHHERFILNEYSKKWKIESR